LSVAVDADPERVRPIAEPYSFPTAIDSANVLGRLFDFDVVPNGLLMDASGVIQFLHVGGFYLRRPEVRQQVEALLAADLSKGERPELLVQEPLSIEIIRGEFSQHPDDPDLLMALGDALLRENRATEATEAFARAVELAPREWAAAFGLGTAHRHSGETAAALRWWRRALEIDPRNFTVRKQIWREEHPERFYPTIDTEWQKEQLAREGYVP
jgi:tetratricopeptide (TPR) repeat protein